MQILRLRLLSRSSEEGGNDLEHYIKDNQNTLEGLPWKPIFSENPSERIMEDGTGKNHDDDEESQQKLQDTM